MAKLTRHLTLASARERIAELQRFVDLVEAYKPVTIEEIVIYEYAIEGSVTRVATKLNDMGHRIDGRKYEGKDITEIINRKPIDPLHEFVQKIARENNPYKK